MAIGMNGFRAGLDSGEVLVGAALPFFSPDLVEWCGLIGFDWVFLDGEHLPLGVETCYDLVRAADACGIATLARLPRNEPSTVLSYAESGVDALMVPHVLDAESAEHLVASIRYPPLGVRGALSSSRAAGFGLSQTPSDYFSDSDRHAVAVPLIEDEAALPNAGAIARVSGVELVFIGPGDLSMSMGHPGEPNHPEVRERIDEAVAAISEAGIPIGTAVGSAEAALDAIERGFTALAVSLGGLMASSVRGFLKDVDA